MTILPVAFFLYHPLDIDPFLFLDHHAFKPDLCGPWVSYYIPVVALSASTDHHFNTTHQSSLLLQLLYNTSLKHLQLSAYYMLPDSGRVLSKRSGLDSVHGKYMCV